MKRYLEDAVVALCFVALCYVGVVLAVGWWLR